MKCLRIGITFLLALFINLSFAAIYEQQNGNSTSYSDTPNGNAQAVILPHSGNSAISLPSSSNNTNSSAANPSIATQPETQITPESKTHVPYKTFLMVDPTDQQTYQNARDIPVTFSIDPSLQEGDTIQLFLDGNALGTPTTNLSDLVIHNADRGEHRLAAALTDAGGHLLMKTNPVTIYLHYSAIPTGSGAVQGSPANSRTTPGLPAAPTTAPAGALPAAPNSGYAPSLPAAPNNGAAPVAPAAP